MEKEKDEQKERIEALQQDFLKERDEPIRLGKGNENLKKAVEHLRSDLDKLQQDTKTIEVQYEGEVKVKKQQEEQRESLKKDMADKEVKVKELDMNIKRLLELSQTIDKEIFKITEERVVIEAQIKALESNKKREQEKINHYNKRIDDEKKLYKKIEYENNNFINNIKELET